MLDSASRRPNVGAPLKVEFDWRQCRQRRRPFDELKSTAWWLTRPNFDSPSHSGRRHLKNEGIPFDSDLVRESIKETEIRRGDHHFRRRLRVTGRKNIKLQKDVASWAGHRA
jgi:hypothetical protein